ncbi:2-isopropylmalate synthase [Desulfurispirillum indicum]|uniref:2-isopropylmalate synthase LeuA2 n=1 Tax=Desulfurispirillum indicum TaxID=936456 RepID=UPI001CFA30CB|nr:2-isopropylmalate synthase LeuA2 [Desulfurispirillum indicum]UCZ56710.1 2-isopropylmalate synthase [Desulfurispirillum indicum]
METFPASHTPHSPFFLDVTLRDGNQALPRPWSLKQKQQVFQHLIRLEVPGAEVGFASASAVDFEACCALAQEAPASMVISSLSRARTAEIDASWEAVSHAAQPRVHIVYPVSPSVVNQVLRCTPHEAARAVRQAVRHARRLAGKRGSVQFSGEHFGDCLDDIALALDIFQVAIEEGADVINLPNTVERFRPMVFVEIARQVMEYFRGRAAFAVHCHNDLGMATATTVESYFAGATQLEVSLNGLGERAGNASLYEVVCALENSGVHTGIQRQYIFETAREVAELSAIAVGPKTPIIGSDVFSHRSGIHQDGAIKSRSGRGVYLPFVTDAVGRADGEQLRFTSQSGTAVLQDCLNRAGIHLDAVTLREYYRYLEKRSDAEGEMDERAILRHYRQWCAGSQISPEIPAR